jgi:peptidoglycan/xylan/chitin deacetylase (PgdA/CDA1 family)
MADVAPSDAARAARWSCLMYHEVTPAGAAARGGYFSVTRTEFERQLRTLRALGLRGESLERVAGERLADAVAITFDDGHETHYAEAFPALLAHGMTATFFVITSRVGTPGYATWEQLREMAQAGMSIQSHTHSHPFLSELSRERAEEELRTSKRIIDERLGQRTMTIAFPNGDAPRGFTARDFERLGYRWVATSAWGPNRFDGARRVRRYTVRRDGDHAAFERMARGASPAYAPEGVRLRSLNVLRAALGPSRYARIRRVALRAIGR